MRHTEEKVGNPRTCDDRKSKGNGEHEKTLPDQDREELESASDSEGWRGNVLRKVRGILDALRQQSHC